MGAVDVLYITLVLNTTCSHLSHNARHSFSGVSFLFTFPLPFSFPPFHGFSFLSLGFSYFPVSYLLSTFPLFIFPPSTFLLPSLFLSPFVYSHYFLVCPNFVLQCTPPLFLQFSLWLATFLGFFTALVTLPTVCGDGILAMCLHPLKSCYCNLFVGTPIMFFFLLSSKVTAP